MVIRPTMLATASLLRQNQTVAPLLPGATGALVQHSRQCGCLKLDISFFRGGARRGGGGLPGGGLPSLLQSVRLAGRA